MLDAKPTQPHTQTNREAASTNSPALEFRDVSKFYGPTKVLDGLNLAVSPGETVSLIGPSGSGKTTVLRLAMMLTEPSSGEIRLLGKRVPTSGDLSRAERRDKAALIRRCGMVFQQYNLFPHMTVMQNLLLAPTTVLGWDREKSEEKAREYLRMVGLESKADSYPHHLSGGQQQRIAIARALVIEPEILLLDEITSALDPELVGEVLAVVNRLAAESNITILTVTHEMRFAQRVSDKVAMFADGKIVELAAPEQLFTDPQNQRTREFLKSVLDH